jgi:hypothetical protein
MAAAEYVGSVSMLLDKRGWFGDSYARNKSHGLCYGLRCMQIDNSVSQ